MTGGKKPDLFDKQIATRIRAHRKSIGLSQVALASKLGITFQQVQKYERGINRIGASRLYQLARIFNLPISAFFPDSEATAERAEIGGRGVSDIFEFALSAEGWRLCRAFFKISNPHTRKSIVRLMQELTDDASGEATYSETTKPPTA